MFSKGKLYLAVASLIASAGVYAAPGDLDGTFGSSGVLDVGTTCQTAFQSIQSSDGGVLVVGKPSNGKAFFIRKYDSNGQALDTNFGVSGVYQRDVPAGYTSIAPVHAITLYNDKIAVLGQAYNGTNPKDVYLAVVNPDGTPDLGFGSGGVLIYQHNLLSVNKEDVALSLAAHPDGRIVVGATYDTSQGSSIVWGAGMARIMPNGTFDTSLGTTGRGAFAAGTLLAMALSPDDTLYGVVGNKIKKLPAPGTSTVNFGVNGVYTFNIGGSVFPNSAIVQADGKLLISGRKGANAFIARFNSSGSNPLDTTFGGGLGYVEYNSPILNDFVSDVAMDGNDVVAAGYSASSTSQLTNDVLVFKADPDGALKTSFGINGFVHYDMAGAYDRSHHLNIQNDGKILVAGRSDVGATRKCTVLRYEP